MTTKLKIAAALMMGGLTASVLFQMQTSARLRSENRTLLGQVSELEQSAKASLLSNAPTTAEQLSDKQFRELVRLRGQVGVLRKQLADANQTGQKNSSENHHPTAEESEADPGNQEARRRMVFNQGLVYSLIVYADKHQERIPTSLDVAADLRPDDVKTETNLLADQFELLYQGKYSDITNLSETIIVREKEPWLNPKGEWMRTYGFADGHSEAHVGTNGDFESWEKDRLPKKDIRPHRDD